MSILGNRVPRVEDPRLLTVGGTYCADLREPLLDGALHATFVRSTIAHGRLAPGAVDTGEALAMPGVAAVVTAADLDIGPLPPPARRLNPAMRRPFLATDRVRFVGEPVAVVLAERPEQGVDAAEAVWVDAEPLAPVVDPEAAVTDETLLFDQAGTNKAMELDSGRDAGFFAGCDVVVTGRFVNQRVAAVPLETRSAAATWTDDGRAVLWCSTQNAHGVRDAMVGLYGMEPGAIRVIAPDVGGGFGPKIGAGAEELLLPWLARHVGRPVRFTETRTENLLAMGHGRAQIHRVEVGGRRDGTIVAYRLSVLQDAGAYPSMGAFLPFLTRMMAPGTYAFERVECDLTSVVTNTTPIVSYRGAGRPEATAAVERAVDLFAAEIGMDPADVRRRNLVPPFTEPYTTAVGTTYDCGDFPAALETALAAAGYDDLRAEQRRRRDAGDPVALGIGVSTYVEVTAGPQSGQEYAAVEMRPDGTAVVRTGASPHGQGLHTAFAQLASAELGVPLERIEVVHGDTDLVPRGVGTMGSRSLQLGGAAVRAAAEALVAKATETLAERFRVAAYRIAFDKATGTFTVADGAGRATWEDLPALQAESDFTAEQPTFPFGAHVAVVEVDTETGDARLVRMLAVDDAGRILNPLLAEGQRHGGIAQGVAQALYEEVRHDADGNPTTTNLADYGMISAAELPPFELVAMETPTWVNPLGAKGIGESGTIGSTPAVQSAVCDALAHLGVRHLDMPCTPERIWRAIQGATT